jgi:hypothetical protein
LNRGGRDRLVLGPSSLAERDVRVVVVESPEVSVPDVLLPDVVVDVALGSSMSVVTGGLVLVIVSLEMAVGVADAVVWLELGSG